MEWVDLIKYIDAGVLITIVFLFIKGYIVSKYTVTRHDKAYKETLEKICEIHKETVKMITASFEKSTKDLKDVFRIFKKKNGIK